MTKFVITFMVAFIPNVDKKAKLRSKKRPKSTNTVSSVSTAKTMLAFKGPLGFFHAEYTFIPNKFLYAVDIVFYGDIAKVFTLDGCLAQRTVAKGEMRYCIFTVSHDLMLSDDDILILHQQPITMKYFDVKSRCSAQARLDPTRMYYVREDEADPENLFPTVYKVDPNQANQLAVETMKDVVWECFQTPGTTSEAISKINSAAGEFHRKHAISVMNEITSGDVPAADRPQIPRFFTDTSSEDDGGRTKSKGKSKTSSSKSGKSKTVVGAPVIVTFPGEMLFTDSKELVVETSLPSIPHIFGFITVDHLLSLEQKLAFNPVIISLTKIYNLPCNILKRKGCESIYLKYKIPIFGEVKTKEYPLKKTIRFQESRAFLTHHCSRLQLIKFIQTGRILIEVRGICVVNPRPECPCMFGDEITDEFISKRLTKFTRTLYQQAYKPLPKEDQLLCVAPISYDGSLQFSWSYITTQSCFNTSNLFMCGAYEPVRETNIQTTNEINYSYLIAEKFETCVLQQKILIDCDTCVGTTTMLTAPLQMALLTLLTTRLPYNRILMIIYDQRTAVSILHDVTMFNKRILPNFMQINHIKAGVQYLKTEEAIVNFEQMYDSRRSCLTGFMIDSANSFIMYFEGPSTGFIQSIWHKVMHLEQDVARVVYNSDLIFNTRQYSSLLANIAVFPVTLKEPLEVLKSLSLPYLEGSMPIPAWNVSDLRTDALQKLDMMIRTPLMRQICQQSLLPSIVELLCFSIEFGLAYRYLGKERTSTHLHMVLPRCI